MTNKDAGFPEFEDAYVKTTENYATMPRGVVGTLRLVA